MKEILRISVVILLIFLCSCSEQQKTETYGEFRLTTKDDRQILIHSLVTKTELRGVFTDTKYDAKLYSHYRLDIKNKNQLLIRADLGSEEPKHLLVCGDDIFLHLVGEYYAKKDAEDVQSPAQDTADEYKIKMKARYKKLVDERYFFNLLGEAVWVVVEDGVYDSQLKNNSNCIEYALPNENIYKDIR